jgi:hypothetical protein
MGLAILIAIRIAFGRCRRFVIAEGIQNNPVYVSAAWRTPAIFMERPVGWIFLGKPEQGK